MSDDGFFTIPSLRRGRLATSDRVSFFGKNGVARYPLLDTVTPDMRAMWQWNGNGTLRLRFSADGDYRVTPLKQGCQAQSGCEAVNRALGRTLDGQYPITRIDGSDIYIDISEAMKEATR